MKTWHRPQLIVLVRTHPEEAILDFCKSEASGDTPHQLYEACLGAFGTALGQCGDCMTMSTS